MRAAVLGSPIAHSLSPALHRAAYRHLGLDWTYEAVECTAGQLPALLAGLDRQWVGLSLTMPLKTAVVPLLDEVDEVARLTGAANTVLLAGRRGANTDVAGMVATLADAPGAVSAVLLGAGATARSAVAALARTGVRSLDVVLRTPARAAELRRTAEGAGVPIRLHPWPPTGDLLAGVTMVVSTVPAAAAAAVGVPDHPGVLFDVVYDPWPTPLAGRWAAAGGRVLSAVELLVQQAAVQVVLMTGCRQGPAELVPVLRRAAQAALSAGGGPGPDRPADPLKA